MTSVTLSKKFGVNPSLTFCPRCGKDAQEIIVLGDARDYECSSCHKHIVGKRMRECPFCGSGLIVNMGPYDGSRSKLPASDICDKCKESIKELKEELDKGGIAWKCEDCKSEGVINHDTEMAIEFRKLYPDKSGIIFTKKNCPLCRAKEEQDGSEDRNPDD